MIVDLMLANDIGRVAIAGFGGAELFVVEPFPAVHHLVYFRITARLPDSLHTTDLLRAAFPGGSPLPARLKCGQ